MGQLHSLPQRSDPKERDSLRNGGLSLQDNVELTSEWFCSLVMN